jgi:hypothetical protein
MYLFGVSRYNLYTDIVRVAIDPMPMHATLDYCNSIVILAIPRQKTNDRIIIGACALHPERLTNCLFLAPEDDESGSMHNTWTATRRPEWHAESRLDTAR